VIVLDIGLPDVSGADLCARFREFLPHLPVIVCTGAADPEEVLELQSLGVKRFFSKPIAIEDLVQGVHRALTDQQ
jgi:DNA-binding NarL/FixJ family response regulator